MRLYGNYISTTTTKLIFSRRVKVNEKIKCIIDPLRDLVDTKMTLNYYFREDALVKQLNIYPRDLLCKNYILSYQLSMLTNPSVLQSVTLNNDDKLISVYSENPAEITTVSMPHYL